MTNPLAAYLEANPTITCSSLAHQIGCDPAHLHRIKTGAVKHPREPIRRSLHAITGGAVAETAWAEPPARLRRNLPQYDFTGASEGDRVLECCLSVEGGARARRIATVSKVNTHGVHLVDGDLVWSQLRGWAKNTQVKAWLVPLAPVVDLGVSRLFLDGKNGAPRLATAAEIESADPATGLLPGGWCQARVVPVDWPHLGAYLRNRAFDFNI